MRTGSRVAAVIVLAALAVTGCAADAESPGTLPALSPAPSPSPSPTTPATLTTAELEAGARNYYEVLGQALSTSDMTLYKQVAAPSCGCYRRIGTKLEERKAKGLRSTARAEVLQVLDPRVDSPIEGRISVVFEEAPATIIDGAGAVVERTTGTKPRQEELTLQRVDGRLLVVGIIDFGVLGA